LKRVIEAGFKENLMKKDTGKERARQARVRAKAERRAKRVKREVRNELRRNQQAIAKRLMAGEVPLVMATAWGFVEGLLDFLTVVGFWEVLSIDGQGFKRKMVSVGQWLATYELKVLLGIVSMNQVAVKLFREVAVQPWVALRLIGYTTQQLSGGICQRGYGDHKPMHASTLANAIARLNEGELDRLLEATTQRLVKRRMLWSSHGHYALDASDLPTSAKFKGAGRRTTTQKRRSTAGEWVEVLKTAHGFKLLIVYEVKLRLVVAAKLVRIQDSETLYTLELVQQARRNLGVDHPIRVLLADRGFLDGQTLWTLKHDLAIDWVVPVRTTMDIASDARQLATQPPDDVYVSAATRPARGPKGRGQVSLRGVFDLATFHTYGDAAHQLTLYQANFKPNLVNALVVTHWRAKPYLLKDQPVFATSLDVSKPLHILDLYDLRSLIENTAFRELKQGWHLAAFPKRSLAAARAHVFLTLLLFSLVNAFCAQRGQALAKNGIRRQRLADFQSLLVMVVDEQTESFAFFQLEELLILLGHPPTICLFSNPSDVRQRYPLAA
jgi:DDE family transposase